MNRIKVLLFATLRDRADGKKFIEIEFPDGTTVRGLKDQIAREYPNLKKSMEAVLVAVAREYAFDENVIPQGAEVAMFPPVSGG
jgi:molybdopterin converting factor subunit 1